MSKKDKDSYARDTLQFSIPDNVKSQKNSQDINRDNRPETRYGHDEYTQSRPQGQKNQRRDTQGQRSQGQRTQSQRPQGQRPQSQRTQGKMAQSRKPQGQGAQSRRPYGQRPQGQNPPGQRLQGNIPNGQSPHESIPQEQYYQEQYLQERSLPEMNMPEQIPAQKTQRQRTRTRKPQGQRPDQTRGTSSRQKGKNKRRQTAPKQRQENYFFDDLQPARKKKRGGLIKKILLGILIFILAVFLIYSAIVLVIISRFEKDTIGDRHTPTDHEMYQSSSVRNILFIGNDSSENDKGRSDSMMLFSINSSTNKIYMVSLLRDAYVNIPGYGWEKMNAAYKYGGPELVMDTIEDNYYIDVDEYFSVNFTSFAAIIDAIGGVDMTVTDEEAGEINRMLKSKEGVSFFGEPKQSDFLDGGGTYHLNGKQALFYSRLRYVGDSHDDFNRTARQRDLVSKIIDKMGIGSLFSVLTKNFPDVHTNMSSFDMYLLSLRAPLLMGFYDVEQLRIPSGDTWSEITLDDGAKALEIDFDVNREIIKDKLYGN